MTISTDKLDAIIKYIESWRETNFIDGDNALTDDQLAKFTKDIESEMIELKIDFKGPVDGANVTPYNGPVGNTYAYIIAEGLSKTTDGKVCYISDTEAGQLLNNEKFMEEVQRVAGSEDLMWRILNGTKGSDGVRSPYVANDSMAINDFVSKNVMETNAHGNVLTLTTNSTKDSVWTQTELPTLLDKVPFPQ